LLGGDRLSQLDKKVEELKHRQERAEQRLRYLELQTRVARRR
jgi:hypothetical protein